MRRLFIVLILISVVLIFIISGLYFMYGCAEYYPKDYCEKDSDCRGGCETCRGTFSSCKNVIFRGITSQSITGSSVCLGVPCICFTNRCEVLTEERKQIQESCKDFYDEERYLCYKKSGNHLINDGLCPTAGSYKDDCYFQLAKNWYSVGTCEKSGKYKEDCEKEIIESLEKTCELIKPINTKRICYYNLATNILYDEKYCDILSTYPAGEYVTENYDCYFRVAQVKPDSSILCEKAGTKKYECLAITTGDKKLCEMQDFECGTKQSCIEHWTDECIKKVKAYQELSFDKKYPEGNFRKGYVFDFDLVALEEDCEKINIIYKKGSCYLDLAQNLEDINLCYKIEEEYLMVECIGNFPEPVDICEELKEWGSKCYHDLAIKLNDISLCDKIREPYRGVEGWKEECVSELAASMEECNRIKSESSREACISKYATSMEDCNQIKSNYFKEKCISKIQGG